VVPLDYSCPGGRKIAICIGYMRVTSGKMAVYSRFLFGIYWVGRQ
jgi:hypothetical protein